jgi:hypothetical protein
MLDLREPQADVLVVSPETIATKNYKEKPVKRTTLM